MVECNLILLLENGIMKLCYTMQCTKMLTTPPVFGVYSMTFFLLAFVFGQLCDHSMKQHQDLMLWKPGRKRQIGL